MALQITTNINVDFYDNKYVMINAKQYDDKSRLVSITCYNEGNLYNLSARNHTAYIKFRKANGRWVLNSCQINNRGQVLVELTEQMLAESGICYVDLFIVNKGSAIVNVDTGSIVTVDGSSVLTTKAFYIDVQEAVVDNSLIESDNEYKGLTDLMELAHAEYSDTILAAKSWAVGTNNQARENDEQDNSEYYSRVSKSWAIGSTGIRVGENTNNSKYYSEQSASSASKAAVSEANALSYMNSTNEYMNTTKNYMDTTKSHMDDANTYMVTTQGYMDTTKGYMDISKGYMDTTEGYMNDAEESKNNSYDYSIISQRYAVGGTNTVENEEADNAKYYYQQVKGIDDSLEGSLSPKGTVTFEELATVEKFTGYLYVMENSFTTDDTFTDGAGISYPAGTLVYYTVDGLWSCFDGFSAGVATVDEVKSYLDI